MTSTTLIALLILLFVSGALLISFNAWCLASGRRFRQTDMTVLLAVIFWFVVTGWAGQLLYRVLS
jgi:hypothetical protein